MGLGDPEPAPVVDREPDRLMDVGLAGEEGDLEALGHRHRGRRLGGESPAWRKASGGVDPAGVGGRPRRVEPEVIEVEVPPAATVLVDQPDDELLALVRGQVDDHARQVLGVIARGPRDDLAVVLTDQLHAGLGE